MRWLGYAALAVVVATLFRAASSPSSFALDVCTGGIPPLDFLAVESDTIVLAYAVEVGGPINSAPTLTPTVTPAATSTAAPTAVSPQLPVPALPLLGLEGYGAELSVETTYAGATESTVRVDWEARSVIEHEWRELEAGTARVSLCPPGVFTPRYVAGQRYLLFADRQEPSGSLYTAGVFVVEGNRVALNDARLQAANTGFLHMNLETHKRFFSDREVKVYGDDAYVTESSVPLTQVVRAVAHLRGDPSIAPPDTGSAGLVTER